MTTTPAAIRDRLVAIIAGIVPTTEAGVPFREHRHESLDLRAFAEKEPEACFRLFEVRYSGARLPPEVSDTDVESEERSFEVAIAYASTNQFGDALDRDDVIDQDVNRVNHYVGTNGYGTVTDATMITDGIDREDGDVVTIARVDLTAVFYRQQAA